MQKTAKMDVRSLAAAIHKKCVECSGGSITEASKCQLVQCPLYPYRIIRKSKEAQS